MNHRGKMAVGRWALALFVWSIGLALPLSGWSAPITTQSAVTLGFEGTALVPRVRYSHQDTLLRDGDEVPDPLDREVDRIVVSLGGGYRLRRNLTLRLGIPWVSTRLEQTIEGTRRSTTASGLGDIILVGRYRFFKHDAFLRTTQLAVQASLKFPTGATDAEDDEGERLPPPFQVGTGSFDASVGLNVTQVIRRWSLHSNVAYRFNTEGAQDFRFGDVLLYNLDLEYRWKPWRPGPEIIPLLELNGRHAMRAERAGRTIADSGGDVVSLSPGMQYSAASGRWLVEVAVQIPVVRELNGTQLAPPPFTLIVGFRYQWSI